VTARSAGPVLNLGCGRKRINDAINVDVNARASPDVICDLDRVPWPFRDGEVREVFAHDVIEHLHDVVTVMDEIHRVCRTNAIVRITAPHFSSPNAFSDPTHRRQFGASSFDYFTGDHELSFYTTSRFRRRVTNIVFTPTLLNKLVRRLANRWPARYERRWAWLFPAWFIYVELEVVKSEP
jgi:SAM-dependent methyltransferase